MIPSSRRRFLAALGAVGLLAGTGGAPGQGAIALEAAHNVLDALSGCRPRGAINEPPSGRHARVTSDVHAAVDAGKRSEPCS